MAAEKEADFESIAKQLNLNIDKLAYEIVSLPSPTNRRQTVRKVNAPPSRHASSTTNPISFTLNMIRNPNTNESGDGGSKHSPKPVGFTKLRQSAALKQGSAQQSVPRLAQRSSKMAGEGQAPLAIMQMGSFGRSMGQGQDGLPKTGKQSAFAAWQQPQDDPYFHDDPNFIQNLATRNSRKVANELFALNMNPESILDSPMLPLTRQRSNNRNSGLFLNNANLPSSSKEPRFSRQNSNARTPTNGMFAVSPLIGQ